MTASARWTLPAMLDRAARGAGKVDALGRRGATMVSLDEIEAMAGALAVLGLHVIHPGAEPQLPAVTPLKPLKGHADV